MTVYRCHSIVKSLIATAVFVSLMACDVSFGSSAYMKPWRDIFRAIHPNQDPEWRSFEDAQEWARKEIALVEPTLIRVLESQVPTIPWASGLGIARTIPTEQVRNVLYQRLVQIIENSNNQCLELGTLECGATVEIIDILSRASDMRIEPLAVALVTNPCQPALVVERSITALQRVGTSGSLTALARVPLRSRYSHISRSCELAEKIIDARLGGRDVFVNIEDDLKQLTRKYLAALSAGDYDNILAVQTREFNANANREMITKQILTNPDTIELVKLTGSSVDQAPFEIDRAMFSATSTINGYTFLYVLEPEGWRISNVERLAP